MLPFPSRCCCCPSIIGGCRAVGKAVGTAYTAISPLFWKVFGGAQGIIVETAHGLLSTAIVLISATIHITRTGGYCVRAVWRVARTACFFPLERKTCWQDEAACCEFVARVLFTAAKDILSNKQRKPCEKKFIPAGERNKATHDIEMGWGSGILMEVTHGVFLVTLGLFVTLTHAVALVYFATTAAKRVVKSALLMPYERTSYFQEEARLFGEAAELMYNLHNAFDRGRLGHYAITFAEQTGQR